jgi:NADH:ubiquinone oxidoreductase subunit 4 (subunit M)
MGTALVTFLASLMMLVGGFEPDQDELRGEVGLGRPSLGIHFHLGIDGISLWLVLLTTFLMPIVFLSTMVGDYRQGARVHHLCPRSLRRACSALSWRLICSCST